ncbi:hypothetical protein SAMN06297229_1885 [Pseudidiomarina planktonica]|uniref:Uncharacterized protein n=1 Tax=Pseudidiomarina planktonica TaxID=1323738 RepID=A0A1Y6G142_9GAMM|nr:hypothetical protein [Pseudidiomarina planktonica]RUO63949.1 hypothetical protein CWI77_09530 [Pseudidiomarina planktonica]SMQ79966.1 hypothetical protein SAMN06297229_1885 [Pseudidiomarina planktonica]
MEIQTSNFLDILKIVSVLSAIIAFAFAVYSFKKQLKLNFFADYTKRYQEISLNFPVTVYENEFSYDNLSPEIREHTLRYMRAYFDLCSEEYFLNENKNLDKKTWKEWESGMKASFSKPAFRKAWKTLKLDSNYYSGFTAFVKSITP